jgi:hypothetical protein
MKIQRRMPLLEDVGENGPTLKAVNRMLAKEYPGLLLEKHQGQDSYYWCSDDKDLSLYLAGLPSTTVDVYRTFLMSLDWWREQAKEIMSGYTPGTKKETPKPERGSVKESAYKTMSVQDVAEDIFAELKEADLKVTSSSWHNCIGGGKEFYIMYKESPTPIINYLADNYGIKAKTDKSKMGHPICVDCRNQTVSK